MPSLKEIASCIGMPADFAIVHDFFGYWTGAPGPISLRQQLALLQSSHIHLNLIKVGVGTNVNAELDVGLKFMRDTYATVGVGVGRILRFKVPDSEANSHATIDDDDEATDLTNEWTVHNDGLDVFLVDTIKGGATGQTVTPTTCDKDDGKEPTGNIVAIGETFTVTGLTGTTLAHEIGHYLGLDTRFESNHHPDSSNLMFPSDNDGKLEPEQGVMMKAHCAMRPGC
jgi:hypothetical protein